MAKIELSKEDFNREMMKKHHGEMISAIRDIRIPEPKDNSFIISQLDKTLASLTKKLEVLQTPNITLPKQENNQKEVVNLLTDLIKEVKNIKLEEKPKEWEFKINRNQYGFITSVTATNK